MCMCGLQFGQAYNTDHHLRPLWSPKVREASVGLRMEHTQTLRSLWLESQLVNGLSTSLFHSIYHSTWNPVLSHPLLNNRGNKMEQEEESGPSQTPSFYTERGKLTVTT